MLVSGYVDMYTKYKHENTFSILVTCQTGTANIVSNSIYYDILPCCHWRAIVLTRLCKFARWSSERTCDMASTGVVDYDVIACRLTIFLKIIFQTTVYSLFLEGWICFQIVQILPFKIVRYYRGEKKKTTRKSNLRCNLVPKTTLYENSTK